MTADDAATQDAERNNKATLYGWFPAVLTSVEMRFGTVESEATGSGVLSNLDMAFMGGLSARNDRWGFAGDMLYTSHSSTQDTPFALYGKGIGDVKLTTLSGYALYRVSTSPKVLFDVGAGFRSIDANIDVSLNPRLLSAASEAFDGNWSVSLLAARFVVPLSEDWFLMGFAAWGGTGSDNETWQVHAGVGDAFNANWSTQLGYRHTDINKVVNGRDVSVSLDGAAFALSCNF